MKKYPLIIENIGEDTYVLMSRGHQDYQKFMDEVTELYPSWPMGYPEHIWFRAVPTRLEGYICLYVPSKPNIRGSFPVTVTTEAYGDERWLKYVDKKIKSGK